MLPYFLTYVSQKTKWVVRLALIVTLVMLVGSVCAAPSLASCEATMLGVRAQIEPLKIQHRYREARAVVLDGIARIKAECGEVNRSYANALRDRADIDSILNDPAAARDATEVALRIREKLADVDLPTLLENRWKLATLEMSLGRYDVARPLLQQALADVVLTDFARSELHCKILQGQALLEAWEGRFAQAEQSLAEAHAYMEVDATLNDRILFESAAAKIYRDMGMLGLAEQYLRQQGKELASPPAGEEFDEASMAMLRAFNDSALARVLVRAGRYEEAKFLAAGALDKLMSQPRDLRWFAIGPQLVLIEVETALGRPKAAIGHAQSALSLVKSPTQEAELRYATAFAQGSIGQHKEAQRNIARAVEIARGSAIPAGPQMIRYLELQARLAWAAGDLRSALTHFRELQSAFESQVLLSLAGLPEVRQRAVLSNYVHGMSAIVSFHFATKASLPGAIELAIDTVLQRKGRQLETAVGIESLGRRGMTASATRAVGALHLLDAQIAAERLEEALAGESSGGIRAQELLERRTAFERELRDDLSVLGILRERASGHSVATALRRDETLIEYVRYKVVTSIDTLTMRQGDEYRFAAFVVNGDGVFASIDLGESSHIESLTQAWLRATTARDLAQSRALGRQLDAAVLEPVLNVVAGHKRIFIAGDGAISGIAFAALVGPDDRYRVQADLVFSYLTTGSELLRPLDTQPADKEPVVMGSPDFDSMPADRLSQGIVEGFGGIRGPARGKRLVDGNAGSTLTREERTPEQDLEIANQIMRAEADRVRSGLGAFAKLPAAAQEAEAVAEALKVTPILGKEASKFRFQLETTRAPRMLHVATHAYVLESDPAQHKERVLPLLLGEQLMPIEQSNSADPMLRSGIALAGANRPGNSYRYLVTALELGAANLGRTELIVLSACKTARGQIMPGEGVIGLRRALELSGAHSSLTTLWSIADQPTKQFMALFYAQLLRQGTDLAEALAHTQKAMLAVPATAIPADWAPFYLSGRTSPAIQR